MNEKKQEQIIKEDLLLFINACCTCTIQNEFYANKYKQTMSLSFLHKYMLINYRVYYMRLLAVNINQFNIAQIILNLLANGKSTQETFRREENALITNALYRLPSQRVYKLFEQIRIMRINNRRTRAIIKKYLTNKTNLAFDIVKYRRKINQAVAHIHAKLPGEANTFLFSGWKQTCYCTELFENYRQAHFSEKAVYKLPFTIAQGFAGKHKISRSKFFNNIEPQMTDTEKLRFQESANKEKNVEIKIDLAKAPLTRLSLYILSLPLSKRKERYTELDNALNVAARRLVSKFGFKMGKVAAVLDCSYSMSGSTEKKQRPLAISLASHYLFMNASDTYRAFSTQKALMDIFLRAKGQSDLVTPLLDALDWKPDVLFIVSDGYENVLPGAASEVIRIYRSKIDKHKKTRIIHYNPVFDPVELQPLIISEFIPTLGVRDAEDIPSLMPFANLSECIGALDQLDQFLNRCTEMLLKERKIR